MTNRYKPPLICLIRQNHSDICLLGGDFTKLVSRKYTGSSFSPATKLVRAAASRASHAALGNRTGSAAGPAQISPAAFRVSISATDTIFNGKISTNDVSEISHVAA